MTLNDLIQAALREDMPRGDLTTDSLALTPRVGQAKLVAKEDLVLSGTLAFERTMLSLDPTAKVNWQFKEGDLVLDRQVICLVTGDLIQILKAERVALNFVGHLSGIATYTRCFVKQVEHTKTKILDTRKTLPAFRDLEKKAVVHGGGMNHRYNLSDAILIKENHIHVAGGIRNAVERVREHSKEKIEIECSSLDDVKAAVSMKVDRVLLDNMSNETLKNALELVPDWVQAEASGNMTVDRVKSVAELGVDFISVGAITHSAPTADISLLFDWQESMMAPI
ncbi:MAG: carboxylating nicotinate-nucleotide diphosphorylase [Bdellovibrionota bacterium]